MAISRHRWFLMVAAVCGLTFGALVTGGTFRFISAESLGSFYDYQAASLLHGRLDVPEAAISIEAFVVDGRYYGYFGPTPALLRVPLVLFDVAFGRTSRAFMLLDFLAALVAAYLILLEASRLLDGEGGPPGKWIVLLFLLNAGLGCSLFFLGSSAYLYHEAILCGAAFALWSIWCALRHLAAPTGRWWIGALGCGVLSVHARPSVGFYALTLLGGITLSQAWRARREERGGSDRRPLVIAGLAVLGVLSFNGLSYLKFKTFEGCPLRFNVQYDAARLAKIDRRQFHLSNVPFAFVVYFLRPNFTLAKNFPYFEMDRGPGPSPANTKLDLVEPTLGFPYAMPGLFALATIGGAAAFARSRTARPAVGALLAAAVPMSLAMLCAVVISHRYTADFCPLWIAVGAFGAATAGRLETTSRTLLRTAWIVLTAGSVAITMALALRQQGERIWAVPDDFRLHYERLARRADALLGVSHRERRDADALAVQGTMLWTMKRLPEAAARFEAALRVEPNHVAAQKNLARTLLDLGRPDEALAHAETALRQNPALIDAHQTCAEALMALHRLDEAIPHFEAVRRQRPDDRDAHAQLGDALYRAGRMPEALAEFRAALRLAPADVDAHFNVGLALAQTGRTAEAIAEFETVLRLKPDFAPARDCLAQLRRAPSTLSPK